MGTVPNKQSKRREGERGYVLLLVLAVLALGSLVIAPTLRYTDTGLRAASVSRNQLLRQYATDGAVEYSLWQIANNVDGIVDNLTLDNPSYTTSVTLNGIEVPITTEISHTGEGGEPGPLPPTQSGIYLEAVLEVDPAWAPVGQYTDFTFTVHARNYGTSVVKLKGVLQVLSPDFEYIPGSYAGPAAVFTETWVLDHWELEWDFESPLPKIESEGSYPIPFGIRGFLSTGSYSEFGTGYVFYSAFGEEEILQAGSLLDAIAVGLYDITAAGGSFSVLANAGIYDSGTGTNSYQID